MIRGVAVRFQKHGGSIVPVMKNREDGRVVWQVRIFFWLCYGTSCGYGWKFVSNMIVRKFWWRS